MFFCVNVIQGIPLPVPKQPETRKGTQLVFTLAILCTILVVFQLPLECINTLALLTFFSLFVKFASSALTMP